MQLIKFILADCIYLLLFLSPGIKPAGSLGKGQSHRNVISNTPAFSSMTTQNICCVAGLLGGTLLMRLLNSVH